MEEKKKHKEFFILNVLKDAGTALVSATPSLTPMCFFRSIFGITMGKSPIKSRTGWLNR